MDDESNRNQHTELFKRVDDHEKRIIRLEMTHKHTMEKFALGGMIVIFFADKIGLWGKLF